MKVATALSALLLLVFFPLASHLAVRWHWGGAWLFYLFPVVIDLALCGVFVTTLGRGREPLISRFARMEQGALTPELQAYTRALTRVWSAFFVVMAALSASLALWASHAVWSLFSNLVSYLLVAALFLGEYLYRVRRFPHYRHASPWQLLRNIRSNGLRRNIRSGGLR